MANQSKAAPFSLDTILQQASRVLHNARVNATNARKYDSTKVRKAMITAFKDSTGKLAYDWQLDTAEALLLGLDTVVIAGTGSGKTIPCMLPLLLPENSMKTLVVISPLKALQRDQARRFRKVGISAAFVNEDTWSEGLEQVGSLI
ncbi:hypothetical protein QCA50_017778 [Cerrena zonata]|uniref:DNA 3'-5' helicase n=1 Tax=Cerrena zonata TaxID=2478898 RepID=A0AAW0FCK3_9APHY